jgi:hypothetical protein
VRASTHLYTDTVTPDHFITGPDGAVDHERPPPITLTAWQSHCASVKLHAVYHICGYVPLRLIAALAAAVG